MTDDLKWSEVILVKITVTLYLLLLLLGLTITALLEAQQQWLAGSPELQLGVRCAMAGGFGGLTYCLRAVYLNASVRKSWDAAWVPWYFIRPFVSMIVGAVSYVFLKAGLFVLQSEHQPTASPIGFLALAFIAGLNVDRFITKLEDLAQATWGIRPSRTAEASEQQDQPR